MLYLLHPVFFLLIKGLLRVVTVPESMLWVLVIFAAAFAIASAAVVYRLAEVPVLQFLKDRVTRSVVAVEHAGSR